MEGPQRAARRNAKDRPVKAISAAAFCRPVERPIYINQASSRIIPISVIERGRPDLRG
jgi:hypothetical protein